MKNNHQAPPPLPCLCQKNFLLPPDTIFACQDIWEIQCDKTVVYAWALQFWAEKANPPTGGKPHLLAGRMIELLEEMECYLSFEKDVFKGIALPEETPIIPSKGATPQSAQQTPAGTTIREATIEMTVKPPAEKRPPNKFPSWEKVLHLSRPIGAAGETSPLLRGPKKRLHSQSLGEGWFDKLKTRNQGCQQPSQNPLHLLTKQRSSSK